jgi:hypothetical protein
VAKKEIERTAYRQAGHAVVAAHLGFPIEAVPITSGRCTHQLAAWLQRSPEKVGPASSAGEHVSIPIRAGQGRPGQK